MEEYKRKKGEERRVKWGESNEMITESNKRRRERKRARTTNCKKTSTEKTQLETPWRRKNGSVWGF